MLNFFKRQFSHTVQENLDRSIDLIDIDRERLVAAVKKIAQHQRLSSEDLPDDSLGKSLHSLHGSRIAALHSSRAVLAAVAKEASEAAINVGWTTYDVGEIAQSTQTIASAVEEMAASITEVANTSHSAGHSAENARNAMLACTGEVQQAREAMHAIEARTHQIDERLAVLQRAVAEIGTMAGTIAAISGQTNLLALNATIEAARAGEAGRGFSVVAAEVKALSAQTAKSTEQIRAGLSTLQNEMGHISQAVAESRKAVEQGSAIVAVLGSRIVEASTEIAQTNDMSQTLVATLDQQRAATSEVSYSVQGIAEKAKKTRVEIDTISERLLMAETMVQGALKADDDVSPAGELSRLAADVGHWKRSLAGILLGSTKPERSLAVMRGHAAQKAMEILRSDPTLSQATVERFVAKSQKAQEEAERMIDAISTGNWDAGTLAYRAAEAMMEEMLAAAKELRH